MKSRAFQQQPVQRPCVRRKHDEFRVLKKASGAETQEVMKSSEGGWAAVRGKVLENFVGQGRVLSLT